jgi:putrescine transport system ATP-binding protein
LGEVALSAQENIKPAAGKNAFIDIRHVTKHYGAFTAVNDLSLDIETGEFFTLLGGSGCGKTTLLRMIAGFETPDSGSIWLDGKDITALPPYARPVNMMFQSYALFPHMSVFDNVAYGLRRDKVEEEEVEQRIKEMMALVELSGMEFRRPHQLSGGQRQRVALARALIKRPKVLLLDEPLAALDKKLREQTQLELRKIQDITGTTFIMVTHDQDEAMTLSSRMAIMQQGQICQVGSPSEVYENPATTFVADFLGDVNMFQARVKDERPGLISLTAPEVSKTCYVNVATSLQLPVGKLLWVALRPEKINISKTIPDQNDNLARGVITDVSYRGDLSVFFVRLESGKMMRVTEPNLVRRTELPLTTGDTVYLSWFVNSGILLDD